MDLYEGLINRRSIRKYLNKEVPTRSLERILTAAKHAPTGRNNQGLKFFAIKNSAKLKELEEAMKRVLDNDEYSLRDARAMILVMVDRDNPFREVDTACAMMNIYLAALSEGLGACWINQLREQCDKADIRRVLDTIGVGSNDVCYGMMAIGYADEEPAEKPRTMFTKIIE